MRHLIFIGNRNGSFIMAKIQYYGIKYPFTSKDFEKFFVDLNGTIKDKIKSQLMHVIFTPKNQYIRKPMFGTDLIRYIFEMNDTESWSKIKDSIMNSVQEYVPNISIRDIQVLRSDEEPYQTYVRVDYSVKEGSKTTDDTIITQL